MLNDEFVSLYRRFRPGRFSELKGQPHVVKGLQSAVRDGPAHAYLFSGPRGTGKTSAARILARALNCASPQDGDPCGECASCIEIARGTSFDVQELDAASNNGVDAMRELVSHAALATPGRWKVYIVDEVHMLSQAAANALLKTLEEPPSHVVFVLATTDPQKTPITIRSRTQQYEFRLIGAETLEELLREVRDRAGLDLDDEALSVAVRRGRGSARDALSALDQVAASGSAEETRPQLAELLDALCDEDAQGVLVAASMLNQAGWAPQQLAVEIVDDLRQAFLLVLAPELAQATSQERVRLTDQAQRLGLPRLVRALENIGRAQVEMREAPDPLAVLDVALVRLARVELDTSPAAILERLSRLEQARGPISSASGASSLSDVPASASAVGSKPALGALRQRSGRAAQESAGSESPPETKSPEIMDLHRVPATVEPGQGIETKDPPDRDGLVEAWGDYVLRSLPARVKAFYGTGRFISMEEGVASFALPNAPHRDRCAEVQNVVEKALSEYFSASVRLSLVVEDSNEGSSPSASLTSSTRSGSGKDLPSRDRRSSSPSAAEAPLLDRGTDSEVGPDLGDDDFDPDDPGEPLEATALAEARLLEAFPGAEEVPR